MKLPGTLSLRMHSSCYLILITVIIIILFSNFLPYKSALASYNNPYFKYYFIQQMNESNPASPIYEIGGGGNTTVTKNNSTNLTSVLPNAPKNNSTNLTSVLPNAPKNNSTNLTSVLPNGVLPNAPKNNLTKPSVYKLPTSIITSTNQSFTTKTITVLGATIYTTTTITNSGATITTTESITGPAVTRVTTTTNASGVPSTIINTEIKK
jgi:hypothetical protein